MKCKRLVIPLLIIKSNNIRDITAFPSAINNITSSKLSSRAGGEGIAVAAAKKKSVNATRRWMMTTNKTSSSTQSAAKVGSIAKRKIKSSSNVIRWAIHGVATELFHNIIIRTFHRLIFSATTAIFDTKRSTRKLDGIENGDRLRYRQPPKREIAVVTGGTGGIGSYIVQELAYRGYDVVIAGRDIKRGEELVTKIQQLMNVTPVLNNDESMGGKSSVVGDNQPTITFIEYHANIPQSALHMSSYVKELGYPLSILINNAGIMGQSRRLTMHVNLLGPAYLTFALLPLLLLTEGENNRTIQPTIINVGSSAHLRASHVLDDTFLSSIATNNIADGEQQQSSWIDTLSLDLDNDLSTYAKSKLALMQLSTILRHCLPPPSNNTIRIIDAHPGLVWTSLLRNHIGETAVRALTTTGLANIIYKSPVEGAQAIVAALDDAAAAAVATEVVSHNDTIQKQMYYVNGKPGGYASSESVSMDASIQVWDHVIAPALIKDHFVLPKGWGNKQRGGVGESQNLDAQ
jgi:NAD(P)-dependent dehydrogenase (short-subunit alcohol dehydrogenase family)